VIRQKLVVGAVIGFALVMAALEHVAGRHPTTDAPGITRETFRPPLPTRLEIEDGGVSTSPQLTY
jgi:hypothetical protein